MSFTWDSELGKKIIGKGAKKKGRGRERQRKEEKLREGREGEK